MKHIKLIIIVLIAFQFSVNAQEKKIKFSAGTLKICSSKNFKIKGYDGKEVIIKSLHEKKELSFRSYSNLSGKSFPKKTVNGFVRKRSKSSDKVVVTGTNSFSINSNDTTSHPRVLFSVNDSKRKKGLKRLGKKQENEDYGIYFIIEEKNGELIFKDNNEDNQFIMSSNESYEIMIPNSIKLNWDTNGCKSKSSQRAYTLFYDSKASSLTDFDGEVEISTSLSNLKLKDLTGPVSINSIGGNVTIEFDKKKPKKLYSIYSNNGFIDIKLPSNSDVTIDAEAASIFSDLDFNILKDTEKDGLQNMKLKMKKGSVTMKLNAGLGNIYLRKK